jgi:tetratricopeptide (TPR) repeat protein
MSAHRIMRPILCLVVLAVLGGRVTLASAQAKPSPAPSADGAESAEYKQAVEAALEEYRLQHFEEARSLFERAHAIDPNARTLRGLGMVEFERRHYVRAAELLEAALASKKKPLTDEQRTAVEELLSRTRQFISNYAVEVKPQSNALEVELDGKPVELSAEHKLALEAGEHTLKISAPNAVPRQLRLDVKGGEQQTLHIELELKTTADAQPAATQAKPQQEQAHPKRNVLGIALTSAGGAVAVAGGVLGGVALMKANDLETRQDPGADQARSLAIGADVMLGVGIASAVAGVVLLIVKRPHRADTPATAARVDALFPRLQVRF